MYLAVRVKTQETLVDRGGQPRAPGFTTRAMRVLRCLFHDKVRHASHPVQAMEAAWTQPHLPWCGETFQRHHYTLLRWDEDVKVQETEAHDLQKRCLDFLAGWLLGFFTNNLHAVN